MSTRIGSVALESLFDYLDGLTARVTVEDLRPHLDRLDMTVADVAGFVRFSPKQYMRNLLREGPHYHALVLCWRSGQRSPIHNHTGSVCGVRVLAGTATETVFEPTLCSLLKPTVTRDLHAGQVTVSQDADTHQVSNLQAPGTDPVTLHVYSPPLLRMDTFSLTDDKVGQFVPMIYEIHGSGI